jgi:hypothetical protein
VINESQLIERISGLPDDDLLRIIQADPSQYRFDARVYAKAELNKRGVAFSETDIDRDIRVSNAKSASRLPHKIFVKLTSRVATFTFGFVGGLILFVITNYRTVQYPVFLDGVGHAGWPFQFYTFGGWAGMSIIEWPYLLADILIALLIAICIGLAFAWVIGFVKSSLAE